MEASPPDMLIHGGDISFNGPSAPLDLAYAAEEIAALGLPWHAIPGNHDIGEAPDYSRLNQPINRERIDAWEFFEQCDPDVFRVGPLHRASSSALRLSDLPS